MRKLVLILITAIAFSSTFAAVSHAQVPRCNPSAVFEYMKTLKPTGDNAKDFEALFALQGVIDAQNIVCNGYSFEGNGSAVIKPFDLPEGFYTFKVESGPGNFDVGVRVVDGDCEEDKYFISDLSMSEDIKTEALFESTGCKLILEIDFTAMSRRDWTLTIEPLK